MGVNVFCWGSALDVELPVGVCDENESAAMGESLGSHFLASDLADWLVVFVD